MIYSRGRERLPQVVREPDLADVSLDQFFQARAGAIIDKPAVELVGDGHVPHDRGTQVVLEQPRAGFLKGINHAGKMPIDPGQAPFLEENFSKAMFGDHVLEEAVHLPVAVDIERPERAGVYEVSPCPATGDFFLDEPDEFRVAIDVIQDGIGGLDEVVVDAQAGSGELEQRDIFSLPRRLDGIDGVIGGHGLGIPFQIAAKESVKDRHLEPVVGQIHTQEVQREVLVEPAGIPVVQQAPVGHADKRAELDAGDAPQGDHTADGTVPDDLVEVVFRVEVVPDRILGRHLKMPHETEALQGDRIVEQNVPRGGQGVVVEVHDFLPGIHLRKFYAPRDVERENLVKRPCLKAQHGVIALNKPGDRAWMHGPLDNGVAARVHEDFTMARPGIAFGVVLDRAQRVVERMGIEMLLAHALDNRVQAELVLGHDGAVVVDAPGRRLTGNVDVFHLYFLSGDWPFASPWLFDRLGGHHACGVDAFDIFKDDEVDADIQ